MYLLLKNTNNGRKIKLHKKVRVKNCLYLVKFLTLKSHIPALSKVKLLE